MSVVLTANPSSGTAPLTTDLSASVSGTATGTINYTFWWNCNNSGTSVGTVMGICGSIPTPSAGNCASNANGIKCDAVTDNPKVVNNIYSSPGNYTAKVIAERGSAPPAENRTGITVTTGGITFQTTSLPRSVRGEGRTEAVGEVALRASNSGTITAGSSIIASYGARITNSPTAAGNLTCSFGGAPPTAAQCTGVGLSTSFAPGSQLVIVFTANTFFDTNDLINIFGVRLDIAQAGGGVTVINVAMSGDSAFPGSNPFTFTDAVGPVANVIRPSTTVSLPTAVGTTTPVIQPPGLITCVPGSIQFAIVVTETFPSAFTTLAQERAFSTTPLASSRMRLRVRLFGVPAGFTVGPLGPLSTTGSSGTLTFLGTPASVEQTIAGQLISFNFQFADTAADGITPGTNLGLVETAVLNFQISHTNGVPVPSDGLTGPITAEVQLRIIDDPADPPGQFIVSFATNFQASSTVVATVTVNPCKRRSQTIVVRANRPTTVPAEEILREQ